MASSVALLTVLLPPWHFPNGRCHIAAATYICLLFLLLLSCLFSTPPLRPSSAHFRASPTRRSSRTHACCMCAGRGGGDSFMNVPHCPHFVSSHWVLASAPSSSISHGRRRQRPTEEDVKHAHALARSGSPLTHAS